jgi:hypothetical protein
MTHSQDIEMSREDLYQKVWSTPMLQLAKEYGLSDVGLAKICKKHKIPKPPVGYWAKKQFGKSVRQIPLPPITNTNLESIVIHCHLGVPKKENVELPRQFLSLIQAEADESNRIVVPHTLRSPHPLIERVKRLFSESTYSLLPYLTQTSEYHERCLNIRVTRGAFNRALRIMDTFIKAAEKRGYTVAVVHDKYGNWRTCIDILGQKFEICLREMLKRIPETLKNDPIVSQSRIYFFPTGILALEFNGGYVLKKKDGKQPLEDVLNSVMATLIQKAGERFVEELVRQQREKERKERERIEQERRQREEELRRQEEERKRKEQERVDTLFKEANLYESCQNIRTYILAVQNAAIEKDGQIPTGSSFVTGRIKTSQGWAKSKPATCVEKYHHFSFLQV